MKTKIIEETNFPNESRKNKKRARTDNFKKISKGLKKNQKTAINNLNQCQKRIEKRKALLLSIIKKTKNFKIPDENSDTLIENFEKSPEFKEKIAVFVKVNKDKDLDVIRYIIHCCISGLNECQKSNEQILETKNHVRENINRSVMNMSQLVNFVEEEENMSTEPFKSTVPSMLSDSSPFSRNKRKFSKGRQ